MDQNVNIQQIKAELLLVSDRYAWSVGAKNQSAHITAESLYYHYFLHYEFPQKLHSDGAGNFTSKVIYELCALAGIKKDSHIAIPPYGTWSNRMVQYDRDLRPM